MKICELIKNLEALENSEEAEIKVCTYNGNFSDISQIDWNAEENCYVAYCVGYEQKLEKALNKALDMLEKAPNDEDVVGKLVCNEKCTYYKKCLKDDDCKILGGAKLKKEIKRRLLEDK